MKTLEEWMDQNREFLDSVEPGEGHFNRFMEKLAVQNRMLGRRKTVKALMRIAAIFLVICAAGAWIYFYTGQDRRQDRTMIAKAKEIQETEIFYAGQLQARYDVIRNLRFPDEAQKNKILRDLSQNDDTFSKLQEELKADPENEMTVEAMINYYQTRIDVLNNIINNLEQVLNNQSETYKYGGSHETFV